MKGYTVRALLRVYPGLTFIEQVLGQDNQWYTATNQPQRFQTIGQARRYVAEHRIVENRPQLGSDSCPYIIGPRSGRHYALVRAGKAAS